jgi:hydrogenase expression/formation protein HypE
MRRLIQERLAPVLALPRELGDAAPLGRLDGDLYLTTDSFVVSPLFFPGGDIGSLAVHGTVNDLAVSGARPVWLTLSLILEEGLLLETLDRVIASVALAAAACDVRVVTGDTKVVPRGSADRLFINTCGIGRATATVPAGPASIRSEDRLIVSGPIGQHGIAILSAREKLEFDPPPRSDSAPLHHAAAALQQALGDDLRCMRDATRGGVAAVLHEWAQASGQSMLLDESSIPVTASVRGACELLGLDPLYVANEGTLVAAVARGSESRAIQALRSVPPTAAAVVVGKAIARGIVPVMVAGLLGSPRPVDEPAGAPMPRIC